jgi:VIT family
VRNLDAFSIKLSIALGAKRAWAGAGTSFLLFAIGAISPVAPYFVLAGLPAVIASFAASGLALFLIGDGTTLFTGLEVVLRITTIADRLRRRRRDLRRWQTDRRRRYGLRSRLLARARNSARAS